MGVEVVERPLAEEDRVRERAEPRRERRRLAIRPRDREPQERRLDRTERGVLCSANRTPSTVWALGRGSACGAYRPATSSRENSWKFVCVACAGYASTTMRYGPAA